MKRLMKRLLKRELAKRLRVFLGSRRITAQDLLQYTPLFPLGSI
jgi:hypothetical protein